MASGTETQVAKRRTARAKRAKRTHPPQSSSGGALAREQARLDRTLYYLRHYEELAAEVGGAGRKLRTLAREQVDEADPIRVLFARNLLKVSDQTIADWSRRGILEQRGDRPRRLSLGSVLQVKRALEELRAAGRKRDFASALLNRLELEELQDDKRFRTSLAQAKRGERGEWPEGF